MPFAASFMRRAWLAGRHGKAVWAVLCAGLLVLAATGLVSERVTAQDRQALLAHNIVYPYELNAQHGWTLEQQQSALKALVGRVHARVTAFEPLAAERTREPADVLAAGTGACFDRARVIEKAARAMGFQARRVFLLYGGLLLAVKPGGPSHASVEVRWNGRWVFLGTLTPITGFAADGSVWSVTELGNLVDSDTARFRAFG